MSKREKIKMLRGVLGPLSGTTQPIQVSKKGIITISKKNRKLAKK